MVDEKRISKHMTNGVFYLVAFLVGFVLFYLLRVVVQLVLMGYYEAKIPGFLNDFQSFVNKEQYDLFSNQMWSVMNISQFLGTLILGIIMFVFLGKNIVRDLKRFKEHAGENVIAIIFGFIFILIGQNLMTKLYTYLGIEGTSGNQESILMALNSSTSVFMYLSVVILAPVVEELLFRKVLYGMVEETFKMPKIVSIIASALVFAALHAVDVFFFQYFFMALVLCSSYSLFRNNIIVPIGIHFLNNATILAYIFISIL